MPTVVMTTPCRTTMRRRHVRARTIKAIFPPRGGAWYTVTYMAGGGSAVSPCMRSLATRTEGGLDPIGLRELAPLQQR